MIHCGDCIDILPEYPNDYFDLVFADPPYNYQSKSILNRPEGGRYVGITREEWDQFESFKSYDDFTIAWLKGVQRVLKQNGSLWISGSYQSIYRVGFHLQNLGYWIRNEIIWEKPNPTPNFNGNRFCASHENLIWCTKSKKSKPFFNYRLLKRENGNKQLKSIWTIKPPNKVQRNGLPLNVAQKPESLLYIILAATSKEEDKVLDPFCGTGTTGVVCKKMNREFVGIELDTEQARVAMNRISSTTRLLF